MRPEFTDAELIASSLGDGERFLHVFERHYDRIRFYLQRRAGISVGEELAAQTFEVAFAKRENYDQSWPSAEPWLFGIATNLLRNHERSQIRWKRALGRLPRERESADIDHLEDRLVARAAGRSLMKILSVLDEGQREVLLLFALADLSYEEIAITLGISVGTVRSRLSRARQRIRAHEGSQDVIRLIDPEPVLEVRSVDGRA